jgi:hypothetical protein
MTSPDTSPSDLPTRLSRRRVLAMGGGIAEGLFATSGGLAQATAARNDGGHERHGRLPAEKIQEIIQAEGTVTNGVLTIDIARDDIGDVGGPLGVTFTPGGERATRCNWRARSAPCSGRPRRRCPR